MSLIEWTKEGDLEEVCKCIQQGADVNTNAENNGWKALSWASFKGCTEIVKLLLENGADMEAKDNYGETALMLAARWGYVKAVKVLLEYGADVDSKSKYGFTALQYAPYCTGVVKMLKDEIEQRKQVKMARYTFLRHTNFHLAQEIAVRMK